LDYRIKNFDHDYGIILDVLKRHKNYDSYDFHSLVMDVKKIFEKRNAKQALDIFIVYLFKKSLFIL